MVCIKRRNFRFREDTLLRDQNLKHGLHKEENFSELERTILTDENLKHGEENFSEIEGIFPLDP